MALMKTEDFAAQTKTNGHAPMTVPSASEGGAHRAARKQGRSRPKNTARTQRAAEQLSTATTQLAGGIEQSRGAADRLRVTMEQISAGSSQSASASAEAERALDLINKQSVASRDTAGRISQRSEAMQGLIAQVTEQILESLQAISTASERQAASVNQVGELERQAGDIGEIVNAVAHIADQTNLLALNAAIEAARAGEHGKGFAVVADEVRTLAETSETSARDIQQLVHEIQGEVKSIAEGIRISSEAANAEVARGRTIVDQLGGMRTDMASIKDGAEVISSSADESVLAANEALKGAETIAAAAEEQSSSCDETLKMVEQQTAALTQAGTAANELQELGEELRDADNPAKAAEDLAAAAEELSATIEELSRASTQISTSIQEIGRASESAAAATEQATAAMGQLEKGAGVAQERSSIARDKATAMKVSLRENKETVDALIDGVTNSVLENNKGRDRVNALEQTARRIDKIVDSITTVSVQTNMLAVNGSVEAARAGEFGKGFAVVSTDIRNLARESSENAERIKDLVKAIQDQIAHVRRELEDIAAAAARETEKNKALSARLDTVETDMDELLSGSDSMLKAMEETVSALTEAKVGAEQISAAAQEADAASSEASKASNEQSKGINELSRAVEEIAALADDLQSAA